MSPGGWRRALVAAAALLLGGCAMLPPVRSVAGTLDAALFPTAAPVEAPRAEGGVLLALDAARQVQAVAGGRLSELGGTRLQLPIGEIVAAAATTAFAREFALVQADGDAAPSAAAPPWRIRVTPAALHFDCRDDFVYFLPIPPLFVERRDVTTRLTVEVQVLDDQGRVRWARSYDSGRRLWKPRPVPGQLLGREPAVAGVQRLAHEQAWQLMLQAARDVRRWAENERRRERVL